jgi:DNA polymerase-1
MVSKTLVLVDGSSYLYRAFHALPDLRNSQGEPTGAIYGVLNMLRRLLVDYKADFLACVFDSKGRTFRDDLYAEYKANRAAMPDDLARQVQPLREAIAALGWPLLAIDGVEADDVIATLARQAERAQIDTVISTGDKDLAQLVSERVTLVNTMSNERLDVAGVREKFGVAPEQIVDYLALVGDSVDNIPGVDKVGPKTAARWLAQYGSLDAVMAHAADIPGALGENLRKVMEWLPTSRKLLTVRTDCTLPLSVAELTRRPADAAALTGLFTRYGFKNWLRDAQGSADGGAEAAQRSSPPGAAAAALTATPAARYESLLTESAITEWRDRARSAGLVALTTQTSADDPFAAQLVGLALAVAPGEAAYIPLAHDYAGAPDQVSVARALELLAPWLQDRGRPKLGGNTKYDEHVLANHGALLRGVTDDALLESYVLDSTARHDMEALAGRYLGEKPLSRSDLTGTGAKKIPFGQVDIAAATAFAAEDAELTLRLHGAMRPQLAAEPGLEYVYAGIEMPAREVLFRMERNGVLVDAAALAQQSHDLGQKMLELEQRAYREAGQPFNLNSPKQIGEIFFERLHLPVEKKTATGVPSTDEEVLEKLALDYPLPRTLLEYRGVSKLKSTYTDKLPRMVNSRTGRVHTTYGQMTAVTGRLASTEPNLQNIPIRTAEGRRIREAFIAPPGSRIVSADYSQIELRIMAHISGDANLLTAFAAGEDIHRATAAEIFNRRLDEVSAQERRYAKVINFGLIYGMSAFGLAQQLGLERATAKAYIESYFTRYPGVARYMEETRRAARERGYVETVLGRRLWLTDIRSSNAARRAGAERAAINAPMQGTAADLIKLAMIAVQDWLDRERLATRLIMQVHDELVFEVPEAELERVRAHVPELMGSVASLKVPLVVDVGAGKNWDEAH